MNWSLFLAFTLLIVSNASAWDYEGHRTVTRIALASLPTNFPSFAQTPEARERIAFLSGEPDRWRNTPDLSLRHVNNPDHYFDVDYLPDHGLALERLTPFRYEFVAQVELARVAHSKQVAEVDVTKDADRTRALIGFLPWTIAEQYSKLKSACSYLKTFQENGGTSEEIRSAQENIIYLMGVLSHFVGDGSQPLHMTKHYNGWVGDNPHGFTTSRGFHAWIDGGFIARAEIDGNSLVEKARPARLLAQTNSGLHTNIFPTVVDYLKEQFDQMVPLYQLDKNGKLSPKQPATEGIVFITRQLQTGGQMLGDLWLTAWHYAPPDTFLRAQLAKRKQR
jgi:hypothetical protein